MWMGVTARSVRAVAVVLFALPPLTARAQDAPAAEHQHEEHEGHASPETQHESHQEHAAHEQTTLFPMREASGTAWSPEASPMYAVHRTAGPWQMMLHGNAFLQYLHESGSRGTEQAGSINWLMFMARREGGGGRVGMRAMISAEPATIRGCGYPDLLASGESCDGEAIHDRQHPHDFVMELAAEYDRPITGTIRWQLYGGPAGEPALGPVAFPHRTSAMPNLLAPITHHWLDATHITFGVVTTGVYGRRWKAEGSVFNGREPDDERWDFDLAALDSYSGRLWFAPSDRWALQASAGHLHEAEAGDPGQPRRDVDRVTASVTYHRPMATNGTWATTAAWGRNAEPGARAANALLVETNVTLMERDAIFGRVEVVEKSAHDLDLHVPEDMFTLAKLQVGYTRYFAARAGLAVGIGAAGSASVVPAALEPVYGARVNGGIGVFLTLRPAAHRM